MTTTQATPETPQDREAQDQSENIVVFVGGIFWAFFGIFWAFFETRLALS
jgi:hypothetical protein